MNGKQKKDKANRAVEFPALREFVSGYLHQDLPTSMVRRRLLRKRFVRTPANMKSQRF